MASSNQPPGSQPNEADLPPADLIAPLRAALARSRQRSVELSLSPGLLARLVTAGRWGVEDALAHIGRAQRPEFRTAALARMAETVDGLPYPEMLAQVKALPTSHQRADVLVALAPRLPVECLGWALELIHALDNSHAVGRAISALAPRIPDELRDEALQIAAPHARLFPNNPCAALIPYLPECLLPLAFEIAVGVHPKPDLSDPAGVGASTVEAVSPHAELLQMLLPRLADEQLAKVLVYATYRGGDQLLAMAASYLPAALIPDAFALVRDQPDSMAFAPLAARLPPELTGAALERLTVCTNAGRLADGLSSLAPRLPVALLPEALRLTRSIGMPPGSAAAEEATLQSQLQRFNAWLQRLAPPPEPTTVEPIRLYRGIDPREPDPEASVARQEQQEQLAQRVKALAALAAELPPANAAAVFDEALQTALSLEPKLAGSCLLRLAPLLPEDLLPTTIAALEQTTDHDRAVIGEALAPRLPEALLPTLARLLARTDAGVPGERALAGLAPRLSADLVTIMLAEASQADEQQLATIIGGLAPRLPPAQLDEVYAAAQAIDDPEWHVRALLRVLPHLPAEQLAEARKAALGAAEQVTDAETHFSLLSLLAPHLPAIERGPVCTELIRLMPAQAYLDLRWLIPVLPDETVLDAIRAVREHPSVYRQEEALAALEARLPAALLDQALAQGRTIGDAGLGAAALAIIAPHRLTVDQMGLALTEVNALLSDYLRSAVLLGLAPHLPTSLMERAVRLLGLLHDASRRAVLAALTPQLSVELLGEALAYSEVIDDYPLLERVVSELAAQQQAGEAPTALPAIFVSDGNLSLNKLQRLVSRLPHALHPGLLALVRAEPDGRLRGKALNILAPQLADALLPEALDLASTTDDLIGRAWALAALAPRQQGAEQQTVLAAAMEAAHIAATDSNRMSMARSIEDSLKAEQDLGIALVHCAPHLTAAQLPDAVASLWTVWEANLREGLLAAFGRALPKHLGFAALDLVRAADQERDRVLLIITLAPCFDQAALVAARAFATTISEPDQRKRCLEALTPVAQKTQAGTPPTLRELPIAQVAPPPPALLPTDELLSSALAALIAARSQNRAEQQHAVQHVGEQLVQLPPDAASALRDLWAPALAVWGDCERPELLGCITALAPWLTSVATGAEREQIADVILDELRMWP